MKRLLASLLLITSLPLMAQVYTYTDAQGNPVFTNEPPPEGVNAQVVNVPPTNTADVPPASDYTPPTPPANQQQTSSTANQDDADSTVYYGTDDDYDRTRAAEAAAIEPGRGPAIDPERVDTPAIDQAVPGPGRIEEPGIRR